MCLNSKLDSNDGMTTKRKKRKEVSLKMVGWQVDILHSSVTAWPGGAYNVSKRECCEQGIGKLCYQA